MEYFKSVFKSCPDGLMIIDDEKTILAMNPAMERITGWREQEVVGKHKCGFLFQCSNERGDCLSQERCGGLRAIQSGEPTFHSELGWINRRGEKVFVSASYCAMAIGGETCAIGVMKEMPSRKEIGVRSGTDPVDHLDGVSTQSLFLDQLRRETERARRLLHPYSLILIDVDHMKIYNNLNGRALGNYLLSRLTSLLLENMREIDILGHLDDGRLAILLPETAKRDAVTAAVRLRRMVEKTDFPYQANQPDGTVTISLGVAALPLDADEPESLLRAARLAMNLAKNRGRNRVCWYHLGDSCLSI